MPAPEISLASPMEGPMGKENAGTPGYSLKKDISKKENISGINSEVPKLSVERQQMKRKKKGGYNLRKSLAWDRAFSTEKGVLDPLELSMISGSVMTSGGGILSAITEEGRELLSGAPDCSNDVTGQGELENNLFIKSPARTLYEDRQRSTGLSLKNESSPSKTLPPSSVGKRKVLSANDVNRSGSKRSGCPRPVASSSLKRPAYVHIAKAAAKESKVSKIPISNPDPCLLSTTSKRSIPSASYSKHKQTSQPANVQRMVGLKPSNNISSVRDIAKASLTSRSLTAKSAQQAKRNVPKKKSEIHSSMSSQHQMVTESNNPSRIVQEQVFPDNGSTVHDHDDGSSKAAFSVSQVQIAKPSCLRMPTPSLGFFNQPKNSSAHNTLKRSSQHISESGIPNSHNPDASSSVHVMRPPRVPYKVLEMAKKVTAYGNINIPSLSTGCSVPSPLNTASQKITKINLDKTNMQQVAMKVPHDPYDCETMNNLQEFHNIPDHVDKQFPEYAEGNKSEKISLSDDVTLQRNFVKFRLEGECGKQLQKESDIKVGDNCRQSKEENDKIEHTQNIAQLDLEDVKGHSQINDMIGHQHVEDVQSISSLKIYGDANSHHTLGTQLVHDANKQSGKQAEMIKPFICEVGQIPNESQRQQTNSDVLVMMEESSKEFKKYDSENIANGSPNAPDCTANELEISNAPSQSIFKREKDKADGTSNRSWKSQVDVKAHFLGDILSVETSNNMLGFSPLHDQRSILDNGNEKFEEQVEVLNLDPVIGQELDDHASNLNDSLLFVRSSSFEESQGENVLQTVKSVFPRKSDVCGSELEGSSSHCLILPAVKDCGFDLTQMVECLHEKDAPSSSVDSKPLAENEKCFIDTQLRHAVKLDGQATSWDIESSLRMNKDLITGAISANFGFSDVCPIRGDLVGTEMENPLLKPQHGPAVKVEGGSDITHVIQDVNIENRRYSPSVKIFDLQGVNVENRQYSPSHNAQFQNDRSTIEHDLKEEFAEQANLSTCECTEAEKTSNVDNQSREICHSLLSTQSTSFEESRIFDKGNIVNVSSKLERSGGSGFCGWSQHKYTKEKNEEFIEVINITEESVVGDAQVQVLDGTSLGDNYDICVNKSTMDNQYSFADDANEKTGECLHLQNRDVEVEQISQDSHVPCSFDEFLLSNNRSFGQVQDENDIVGVLIQPDDRGIKNESVNTATRVSSAVLEVGVVVDRKKGTHLENAKLGLDEIESASKNCKPCIDTYFAHDDSLSGGATSLDFHSSLKMSSVQSSGTESACHDNTYGSLNKESMLSVSVDQTTSRGSNLKEKEANLLDGDNLHDGGENKFSQSSDSKDAVVPLTKSGNERKQDALVIRPPSHAVPFSDEWLAAFEAAGEEILTIKSGAVQHSPTDKSVPEPGPYSPVKRKNNQAIGPFDCTKFSNSEH